MSCERAWTVIRGRSLKARLLRHGRKANEAAISSGQRPRPTLLDRAEKVWIQRHGGKEGRGFWNETFGTIPDRLLQCWRARRSRECSQAAKRGTEQKRQLSKTKRTACRVSRWHRSLFSRTMLVLSFHMKRDKRAAFCCPNISSSDTVGAAAEPSLSDLLQEDSFQIWITVILCSAFSKLLIISHSCPTGFVCCDLCVSVSHSNSPLPLILGHYSFCTFSIYFRESGQIFDIKTCLCTFVWLNIKKIPLKK